MVPCLLGHPRRCFTSHGLDFVAGALRSFLHTSSWSISCATGSKARPGIVSVGIQARALDVSGGSSVEGEVV